MTDPHDLNRFLEAQELTYADAVEELRSGKKRGHWMWYVFPQVRGLGDSDVSRRFALASIEEAQAYLEHPVLGSRLRECTQLVLDVEGRSAAEILGYPDWIKFRSSMTLFTCAAAGDSIFGRALQTFFNGEADSRTLGLLGLPSGGAMPEQ